MVWNVSLTAHAYTEEEKAQAKAWLSAHGYSPDMGGANQAYQDYLNGKFDEELGIDVNGDGIPATTQTTTEGATASTEEFADAEADDTLEEEDAKDSTKSAQLSEGGEKTTEGGDVEADTSKANGTVTSTREQQGSATGTEKEDVSGEYNIENEEFTEAEPVAEEGNLFDSGTVQTIIVVIVLIAVVALLAGLLFGKSK